jgi:hypothetical protein
MDWCKKRNEKAPNLSNPRPFRLENYKLGFTRHSDDRNGGVADIISSHGDFCWGVVFDVTQTDLDILDEKEGVKYGSYRRFTLPNGMVTYEVVQKEKCVQPSNKYVDIIIEGARHYGLPPDWIKHLESFKI